MTHGMLATLVFRRLNLALPRRCNPHGSTPTKIASAMADFSILHAILLGLGQELNLHLPLQCSSEFVAREHYTRLLLSRVSGRLSWKKISGRPSLGLEDSARRIFVSQDMYNYQIRSPSAPQIHGIDLSCTFLR